LLRYRWLLLLELEVGATHRRRGVEKRLQLRLRRRLKLWLGRLSLLEMCCFLLRLRLLRHSIVLVLVHEGGLLLVLLIKKRGSPH